MGWGGGNHTIYPVSNEGQTSKTIEKIKAVEKPNFGGKDLCHFGVSGLFNLTMMANRKSNCGVLFDKDPCVKIFLDKVFAIIEKSETRFDFVKNMNIFLESIKVVEENRNSAGIVDTIYYFSEGQRTEIGFPGDDYDISVEWRICCELFREESWLHTDEKYNFIKSLIDLFRNSSIENFYVFARHFFIKSELVKNGQFSLR